jgi:hypothetical protein
MREMNALDALQRFRDQFETNKDAAKALGVTPVYFGDLLRARRDISPRILQKLGLRKAVVKA